MKIAGSIKFSGVQNVIVMMGYDYGPDDFTKKPDISKKEVREELNKILREKKGYYCGELTLNDVKRALKKGASVVVEGQFLVTEKREKIMEVIRESRAKYVYGFIDSNHYEHLCGIKKLYDKDIERIKWKDKGNEVTAKDVFDPNEVSLPLLSEGFIEIRPISFYLDEVEENAGIDNLTFQVVRLKLVDENECIHLLSEAINTFEYVRNKGESALLQLCALLINSGEIVIKGTKEEEKTFEISNEIASGLGFNYFIMMCEEELEAANYTEHDRYMGCMSIYLHYSFLGLNAKETEERREECYEQYGFEITNNAISLAKAREHAKKCGDRFHFLNYFFVHRTVGKCYRQILEKIKSETPDEKSERKVI